MTVDEVRDGIAANFDIKREEAINPPDDHQWHLFYVADDVFYAHLIKEGTLATRFNYQMKLGRVHRDFGWGELIYNPAENPSILFSGWNKTMGSLIDGWIARASDLEAA